MEISFSLDNNHQTPQQQSPQQPQQSIRPQPQQQPIPQQTQQISMAQHLSQQLAQQKLLNQVKNLNRLSINFVLSILKN